MALMVPCQDIDEKQRIKALIFQIVKHFSISGRKQSGGSKKNLSHEKP